MKVLKFFGVLLVASIVFGFVSCKDKEDDKKPDFTADYPEAPAVAGKITIFAKFEAEETCGDVVFIGSHADWDDSDVSKLPKFTKAAKQGDKDWGAEGWWQVTVDVAPADGPSQVDGNVLGAKPVQLTPDGEFFWDYQIGYNSAADVVVKSGEVEIVDKNESIANECDIFFMSNATAAIIFKKWKNDPCVDTEKYNITFSVTVPASTPNDAVIRIVGSFATSGYPGWAPDGEGMELTKGADGKYSITLSLNEGSIDYKYVINGQDLGWDGEEFTADCNSISNRTIDVSGVATVNDEVINWKGFGDCASAGDFDYTFILTIPECTPDDAVVRIVGAFGAAGYPNWDENSEDMIMTKKDDGTYTITLEGVPDKTPYKYFINGGWTNGEVIASDRTTGTDETIEDTVEAWEGITCEDDDIEAPETACSDQTWTIGDQVWSDYIIYDGDGKVAAGKITEYVGTNTVGDYRNNPGYRGYMYNLIYVQAHELDLCPSPWRVPSSEDFVNLDIALGGTGEEIAENASTSADGLVIKAVDPAIIEAQVRKYWELGFEMSGRLNAADNSFSYQTFVGNVSSNQESEVNSAQATFLSIKGPGTGSSTQQWAVLPRGEANSSQQKSTGIPVRCVRDK